MTRYRLVHSGMTSGGFSEFTVPDDAAAVAEAKRQAWCWGSDHRVIELADVSGPRIRHLTPLTPAEVDAIGSYRANRERAIERMLDQ